MKSMDCVRLATRLSPVLLVIMAACSSTPLTPPAATTAATTPAASATTASTSSASPTSTSTPATQSTAIAAHLDPNNAIARERVVYFAFDSDEIDAEGRATIERHARYLATNPSLAIKVEGHADERGGSEYNLALGQRRAEAVRRALRLLGVSDARVEATSWGEERPVDKGHDEAAWQRNRRGEIVYPAR